MADDNGWTSYAKWRDLELALLDPLAVVPWREIGEAVAADMAAYGLEKARRRV